MKVGTDGVLLGAWCNCKKADYILDIGTGTGLIALMTAQRNAQAKIHALEIEPNAIIQANENIANSCWSSRIQLFPCSLQDYITEERYDCIVCNPPFFVDSTLPPEKGRSLARHSNTLPHEELIMHSARLLAPTGNFCVILPPAETKRLLDYAENQGLYPCRMTYVLPNPGKAPKRCLAELTFQRKACTENEIIVEYARHEYSPEYIELTKDFYLRF